MNEALRLSVAQLRQLADMIEGMRGEDSAFVRLASTDGLTTTLTVYVDSRGFLLYSDGSIDPLDES